MKIYKQVLTALIPAILAACSPDAPDASISVTTDKTEYKAGEPVTFNIKGDADNIVFYSGEAGHEYSLRDRQYADNDLMVDFVSYTDQLTYVHPNLQILISSDFNGIYDPENVGNATWTDVTADFTLPSAVKTNTASGKVNLKKYVRDDNEALVYIAFRYFDMDGTPQRNRWVVRSINIEKVSPEGQSTPLATIKTAGWRNVSLSGSMNWTLPGTQLLAAGNVSTSDKDSWVISDGYKLREAEASTGEVLKNISTVVHSHQHTYTAPGEYEAVFATSSVWYNSSNYSNSTVKIVVTE